MGVIIKNEKIYAGSFPVTEPTQVYTIQISFEASKWTDNQYTITSSFIKADNYIHIFHVTTNSTPPSEEGGGPSLDDGGGRDVILKSIKTP